MLCHSQDLAGIGDVVSPQFGSHFSNLPVSQESQQILDLIGEENVLANGQVEPLLRQRQKIQASEGCHRFDAEACPGIPSVDGQGYFHVAVGCEVGVERRRAGTEAVGQPVLKQTGSGAGFTADPPDVAFDDVVQRGDGLRVAGRKNDSRMLMPI